MTSLKIIILLILSILLNKFSFSQNAVMVHEGEIQFEKRTNAYAILNKYYVGDGEDGSKFAEQYKNNNPQFKINKFVLLFNNGLSYYAPESDIGNASNPFMSAFAGSNSVYTDLRNRTFIAEKNVLGETYIINDSTRKIQWKITDEIKNIAGFSCRRANAVILDSVYVVAFYTDQIVSKSGPESFIGLPGMILGVVLPYEHISWFATKVILKQIQSTQLNIPKGKNKINNTELMNILIKDSTDIIPHRKGLYYHNILL